MKRILLSALALLSSVTLAFGATLTPIQLLNPAGSTSGQAIVSTGASTAPAWGNISVSTLTGVLPIVNGGTGASTQATALTALLASSLVPVLNGGTGVTTAAAELTRIGAASVAQATTALAATGGSISGVTGSFTTLKASSTAKVFATNTSAQSIPSTTATTVTGWTTVADQNSNFAPSTGIFTAPVTGYYWVYATAAFNGTMAVNTTLQMQIFANAVLVAAQINYVASTTPTNYSVMAGALVSLTAGQTVNVKVLQTNATAVSLVATATLNTLSIMQVP